MILTRFSIAIMLALGSAFCLAQSTLTIPANTTYRIGPEQASLALDSLTIGDNATIEVDPSINTWRIVAERADIGNQVTVNAKGIDGLVGSHGLGNSNKAQACESGAAGGNGGDGTDGGDGVSVHLELSIEKFGSLKINTSGGTGGFGGKGGQGQAGGKVAKNCGRPTGGDGGAGGQGGNGGKAGTISFLYLNINGDKNPEQIEPKVTAIALGGAAGTGGQGGLAGSGGEGGYVNRKSLTGNRTWMSGGEAGKVGPVGRAGRSGVNAQALVQENLGRRLDTMAQQEKAAPKKVTTPSSNKQQISELKNQMLEIMKKLEALEEADQ